MTSFVTPKPEFPGSWIEPETPAYGTFPYPFQTTLNSSFNALIEAFKAGYRHIDTAFTYNNQNEIGTAAKEAGLQRKTLFIASKLHAYNNSYEEALEKIKEAIQLIWGKNAPAPEAYLDSFLLHYPGTGDPGSAWKALLEARKKGWVRHIGVSNFEIWHLKKIKEISGQYPEVNQIEFHPWIYSDQVEVLEFCHDKEIAIEGYSPLAQGKRINDPLITQLASNHQTTPARIILKWCMQHGVLPVVGSRNPEHIRANAEPYTFSLSADEIQSLNRLGISHPIRVAEQWHWNSKTAPFGGPVPGHPRQSLLRKLLSKAINRLSF